MACSCCGFHVMTERQFSPKRASAELGRYRRKGPGTTTRLLLSGLVDTGLLNGRLLDVGAGIGSLTFELLDKGISRAVVVDAASAYLTVARAEASRRGRIEAIEFVQGDFVDVSSRLPSAAVVTMDRVICCYARYEPLLGEALRHAERCFAISYPRDRWYVRAAVAGENRTRWIVRNPFRNFVHSQTAMENLIHGAGFVLSSRQQTWTWSVDVYTKRTR